MSLYPLIYIKSELDINTFKNRYKNLPRVFFVNTTKTLNEAFLKETSDVNKSFVSLKVGAYDTLLMYICE